MGKLIESCIIEDFDIYIGDDKNKIKETLYIKSLDDSKENQHSIKIMYWPNQENVTVHKDDEFYKSFSNIALAKQHFKDLNYDMIFREKYIAKTGCIVEVFDLSRNKDIFEENYKTEYEKIDELCDKIHKEFKESELRNYSTLVNICQKNNIIIDDYLYNQGYHDYFEYKDDLKNLPRKELSINEILNKIPKIVREYIDYPIDLIKEESMKENSSCDSQNDLIYADNEVCYYDCHNDDYVFINTEEVLGLKEENENSYFKNQALYVNGLSENLLQVDDNKSLYNEIAIKYNLYDCVRDNCYISDDFKKDIDGVHKINNFMVLSNCIDFPVLQKNLPYEVLENMEKGLESFEYYQSMYDDGKIDIIEDYISKYGNENLINWYEGIMTTDSLIEILSCDIEKGDVSNEL